VIGILTGLLSRDLLVHEKDRPLTVGTLLNLLRQVKEIQQQEDYIGDMIEAKADSEKW